MAVMVNLLEWFGEARMAVMRALPTLPPGCDRCWDQCFADGRKGKGLEIRSGLRTPRMAMFLRGCAIFD
jgi:hypothetical protein